jgi:proteasome accessory factor C
MTARRDTAEAQLERILYILPVAAKGEGVPIDDLARTLRVEPRTVMRDLEQVAARAFYHPAGTVESFTITTDGRTVHVHAPDEFKRPARLNQREVLALTLGLRTLAAESPPARREEILRLASRLEAQLAAPLAVQADAPPYVAAARTIGQVAESDVEYDALALAFDDDGFRGVIADAIELQRMCTIWYLKPGDLGPMYRRIAPHRLIHANGKWYVAAYDEEREALRFFRMDRVLDAMLSADEAPPEPPQLDELIARGAPYIGGDEVDVTVRYSPRVARWIIERVPNAQLERDGSAVLTHRVADPRWIVRHVLQYGGEAVVEGPALARSWVEHAASKVETVS